MVIEFICPGCKHCRLENPENIEDGLCTFCLQRRDFPKKQPPPPPPLRNPNAGHDHSGVFVWVSVMMLCVAFGVLIGWKMHG